MRNQRINVSDIEIAAAVIEVVTEYCSHSAPDVPAGDIDHMADHIITVLTKPKQTEEEITGFREDYGENGYTKIDIHGNESWIPVKDDETRARYMTDEEWAKMTGKPEPRYVKGD